MRPGDLPDIAPILEHAAGGLVDLGDELIYLHRGEVEVYSTLKIWRNINPIGWDFWAGVRGESLSSP